eukprot:10473698-Ditylum_brightwellii.AAC.1
MFFFNVIIYYGIAFVFVEKEEALENSLQSTFGYIFTVASTHIIEGKMPKHPAKNQSGTDGAKKLVKFLKEAI